MRNRHRILFCAQWLALSALLSGCAALGSLLYFVAPRQWVEAEYEFSGGKLLALIESAQPGTENPVFTRGLITALEKGLKNNEVEIEVMPFEKVQSLRQRNRDFSSWSLQRVGREANANYVLYISLRQLVLLPTPDSPLVTPGVYLTSRLIEVDVPDEDAVAWPTGNKEREGRELEHSRQPREVLSNDTIDREARNLGLDVGY
ncbi:MAG: hypothetical protein AB7N71_06700, partial [Phycisphaerae bacterium]